MDECGAQAGIFCGQGLADRHHRLRLRRAAARAALCGRRASASPGFDLDQIKVEKLNAGQSYIQHIPAEKIREHVHGKRFPATSDFAKLRGMDAVLICVPTPLDERREPDLSYVEKTAKVDRAASPARTS